MARRRVLVDITPLRRSWGFRALFAGQLVSFLGSQLTVVAVAYQVFRLTHSSFAVGMVSLAQFGPLLIGSLLGGAVVAEGQDAVVERAVAAVVVPAFGTGEPVDGVVERRGRERQAAGRGVEPVQGYSEVLEESERARGQSVATRLVARERGAVDDNDRSPGTPRRDRGCAAGRSGTDDEEVGVARTHARRR